MFVPGQAARRVDGATKEAVAAALGLVNANRRTHSEDGNLPPG